MRIYKYTNTPRRYRYANISYDIQIQIQICGREIPRYAPRYVGGGAAGAGQCGIYGDTEIRRYATRYVGGKGGGATPFPILENDYIKNQH